MVSTNTLRTFFKSFKKDDIVSVMIVMEVLGISRPTSTELIQHLNENNMIEAVYSKKTEKCYILK